MAYRLLIISVGLVTYTWVLYPCALYVASLFLRKEDCDSSRAEAPLVSIIIAAHNEESIIASKIQNCLQLAYPPDCLEIIVASDGSTDRTAAIVHKLAASDGCIRLIESSSRSGKSGMQNLAVTSARGQLLCFTDAGTRMPSNALSRMVTRLSNPQVGLVTGTVLFGNSDDAIEQAQGFYWRYELWLRGLESRLGILATGSGQALLVRKRLFRPMPTCYGDDCIIPLDIRLQGYKVVQDRDALVFDTMPHSITGELRTRIRMTARNWTGTLARPSLLNPLRFPFTSLGLISHKLLRWLTPLLLGSVLVSNFVLAFHGRALVPLFLQVAFYGSAFLGWKLTSHHKTLGVFGFPFSFCLANVGFLLGLVKAARSQRITAY